jgi:hypothetical protein
MQTKEMCMYKAAHSLECRGSGEGGELCGRWSFDGHGLHRRRCSVWLRYAHALRLGHDGSMRQRGGRGGRRERGILRLFLCESLRLLFSPLDEQTLERTQPLRQLVLALCTEAKVLLLRDDLHAVLLTLADTVDVDGVDNACKGDDQVCGVFLGVLVEGEAFRAENNPDLLPLAHAAFRLENVQPAVEHHAVGVRLRGGWWNVEIRGLADISIRGNWIADAGLRVGQGGRGRAVWCGRVGKIEV